ncbi:hypothetical protein [Ramlibacter sp.]|uniref:hypothetical protein n=1 Tax=Ramlibacter sp. TaxID=1917967 RepID=UPI003D13EFA1
MERLKQEGLSAKAVARLSADGWLIHELPRSLTQKQRDFLLSLVRLEPDWTLLEHSHVEQFPAVRWRIENLVKLRKSNTARFEQQFALLEERLNALA